MVDLDERDNSAVLLRRRQALQQKCGYANTLGTEDLADPTARPTAYLDDSIKIDEPGG